MWAGSSFPMQYRGLFASGKKCYKSKVTTCVPSKLVNPDSQIHSQLAPVHTKNIVPELRVFGT